MIAKLLSHTPPPATARVTITIVPPPAAHLMIAAATRRSMLERAAPGHAAGRRAKQGAQGRHAAT